MNKLILTKKHVIIREIGRGDMNSIRSPARTYYAFCAKETAGRIKRKEAERKQLIEADKVTIFCLNALKI